MQAKHLVFAVQVLHPGPAKQMMQFMQSPKAPK